MEYELRFCSSNIPLQSYLDSLCHTTGGTVFSENVYNCYVEKKVINERQRGLNTSVNFQYI